MILSDLQQLLIERSGGIDSDQMMKPAALTRWINTALWHVSNNAPHEGWWWLQRTGDTFPTVIGQRAYPLATLVAARNPTDAHPITRFRRDMKIDLGAGATRQPLYGTSRQDLENLWIDTATGLPQGWTIDAGEVLLAPIPGDIFTIIYDSVVTELPLVNPGDAPLLPDQFADVAIDYAAGLIARRMEDANKTNLCMQAWKMGLAEMKQMARMQTGPARVIRREPWEP